MKTQRKTKRKKKIDSVQKPQSELENFEKTLKRRETQTYILRLYIAGMTYQSVRAILNIKKICEEYLENRYKLEVVDIYQSPDLASSEQILAAPTLVRVLPLPLRKVIGELSNEKSVLFGLDLSKKPKKPKTPIKKSNKKTRGVE